MNEMKSLTLNGMAYDSFRDQKAREALEQKQPKGAYVKTINGIGPDGNGDIDLANSAYDLKEGYGYIEDVYIDEDGTETLQLGRKYKCFEFIPVKNGISYTMYGCGYALFDSQRNVLSTVYEPSGTNRIREFTPTENGFVRLTVNCEDIAYARFCRTDEKHLEPCDYEAKPSPFFDPRVPCNVHLYGDSTSAGYGLADASKAWSNRLGTLIVSMKTGMFNRRFAAFADKAADNTYYILNNTGYLRFTAYTNIFGLTTEDVGEIEVYIDGQQQPSIVASGSKSFNFEEFGNHTIELYGRSGTNAVTTIATKKQRSFANHAVSGTVASDGLPAVPEGNVSVVMYGSNDRLHRPGHFYKTVNDFVRLCKAAGGVAYIFTPIPVPADKETDAAYLQSNNDVIAQLPSDCINIYKELQLAEMLLDETLYIEAGQWGDGHLNELGHKVLYVVAASKLQLAPPMSEVL